MTIAARIRKQWFLVALLIVIPGTLAIGSGPLVGQVNAVDRLIDSRLVTAIVLFLMGFTLDSTAIKRSFRRPGAVLWASFVNAVILPVLAWATAPLQLSADYRVGLLLTASVPCTMASVSVWTRRAGGNDAVSLLVTLLTNGLCFLITPLTLMLTLPDLFGGGDASPLDRGMLIVRLVQAVLVPILLGQLLRLWNRAAEFATDRKKPIGVIAQCLILLLIAVAGLRSGETLATRGTAPGLLATGWVTLTAIAVHLAALGIGLLGAHRVGFARADRIAVAFASSQKTLPIGVLLADLIADRYPFAVFPLMLYHVAQLVIDTVIADRYAAQSAAITE